MLVKNIIMLILIIPCIFFGTILFLVNIIVVLIKTIPFPDTVIDAVTSFAVTAIAVVILYLSWSLPSFFLDGTRSYLSLDYSEIPIAVIVLLIIGS